MGSPSTVQGTRSVDICGTSMNFQSSWFFQRCCTWRIRRLTVCSKCLRRQKKSRYDWKLWFEWSWKFSIFNLGPVGQRPMGWGKCKGGVFSMRHSLNQWEEDLWDGGKCMEKMDLHMYDFMCICIQIFWLFFLFYWALFCSCIHIYCYFPIFVS